MKKKFFIQTLLIFIGVFVIFSSKAYATTSQTSISVYHVHIGDSTNGGGCYGVSQTGTRQCTDKIWGVSDGGFDYDCSTCGPTYGMTTTYYQSCGSITDWNSQYVGTHKWCNSCGKTIEKIGVTSNGTATHSVNYTYYITGCGMDTTTVVGQLQLVVNKTETEYSLNVVTSGIQNVAYVWQNGATTSSIVVTENGVYNCNVSYVVEGRSLSGVLTYEITDYDVLPPSVSLQYDDSTWSASKTITVSATDTGAGLHQDAYRYHNGVEWSEWSASACYEVGSNGTYLIEVRDALGNTAQQSVEITHIDTAAPNVSVQYDDSTWSRSKIVSLIA